MKFSVKDRQPTAPPTTTKTDLLIKRTKQQATGHSHSPIV